MRNQMHAPRYIKQFNYQIPDNLAETRARQISEFTNWRTRTGERENVVQSNEIDNQTLTSANYVGYCAQTKIWCTPNFNLFEQLRAQICKVCYKDELLFNIEPLIDTKNNATTVLMWRIIVNYIVKTIRVFFIPYTGFLSCMWRHANKSDINSGWHY